MLFTHHPLTFLGEKSQRLVRAAFISSLNAPFGVSQPAEARVARLARQSRGRGSRRRGATMVRARAGSTHRGHGSSGCLVTMAM